MAPYGLRVQIFPTLSKISSTFKQTWEDILLRSSFDMMRALITEYISTITQVDQELVELSGRYLNISSSEKYDVKVKELNDFLENLNTKIIAGKDKKRLRDRTATLMGKAYRWGLPSLSKPRAPFKPYSVDPTT